MMKVWFYSIIYIYIFGGFFIQVARNEALQVRTFRTCESSLEEMECPSDTFIVIKEAEYKAYSNVDDNTACDTITKRPCNVLTQIYEIQSICYGKSSCDLYINQDISCPGDVTMALDVEYMCVPQTGDIENICNYDQDDETEIVLTTPGYPYAIDKTTSDCVADFMGETSQNNIFQAVFWDLDLPPDMEAYLCDTTIEISETKLSGCVTMKEGEEVTISVGSSLMNVYYPAMDASEYRGALLAMRAISGLLMCEDEWTNSMDQGIILSPSGSRYPCTMTIEPQDNQIRVRFVKSSGVIALQCRSTITVDSLKMTTGFYTECQESNDGEHWLEYTGSNVQLNLRVSREPREPFWIEYEMQFGFILCEDDWYEIGPKGTIERPPNTVSVPCSMTIAPVKNGVQLKLKELKNNGYKDLKCGGSLYYSGLVIGHSTTTQCYQDESKVLNYIGVVEITIKVNNVYLLPDFIIEYEYIPNLVLCMDPWTNEYRHNYIDRPSENEVSTPCEMDIVPTNTIRLRFLDEDGEFYVGCGQSLDNNALMMELGADTICERKDSSSFWLDFSGDVLIKFIITNLGNLRDFWIEYETIGGLVLCRDDWTDLHSAYLILGPPLTDPTISAPCEMRINPKNTNIRMLFRYGAGSALRISCGSTVSLFSGALLIKTGSATTCSHLDSTDFWVYYSRTVDVTLEVVSLNGLQEFSIEYEAIPYMILCKSIWEDTYEHNYMENPPDDGTENLPCYTDIAPQDNDIRMRFLEDGQELSVKCGGDVFDGDVSISHSSETKCKTSGGWLEYSKDVMVTIQINEIHQFLVEYELTKDTTVKEDDDDDDHDLDWYVWHVIIPVACGLVILLLLIIICCMCRKKSDPKPSP